LRVQQGTTGVPWINGSVRLNDVINRLPFSALIDRRSELMTPVVKVPSIKGISNRQYFLPDLDWKSFPICPNCKGDFSGWLDLDHSQIVGWVNANRSP
jgi:hypothetical protein